MWIPRLIVAGILGPIGVSKLIGTPGEIELFTLLGMEPAGRLFAGVVEVVAAILIVTSRAAIGAALSVSVMLGALLAHITHIGFVPGEGAGAFIFPLVLVLISALSVLHRRRKDLPFIGERSEAGGGKRDEGRGS